MSLLTLTGAAPLLGCRDPRTARKRLVALGVPVIELDGRLLVDAGEIARAIRAQAKPLAGGTEISLRGSRLAPGERLWDAPSEVGPRRVNGRPRGSRERELRAAAEAYGTPSAPPATSSTSRHEQGDER